jgi:hypothetical protein
MKTSRWKRYNEKSGLWIASSKPVFGYWFRFLKHAHKDRPDDVDWSLYEEWGGKDYILRTNQTDWWKSKWKTLFGYKEGEEDKILYPLLHKKNHADGIRFALMVYEIKKDNEAKGVEISNWEIAKEIVRREQSKRNARGRADPSFDPSKWQFHIARYGVDEKMMKEDPAEFRKKKRTLQSHIGQYMRKADDHLDNVCKGQFP